MQTFSKGFHLNFKEPEVIARTRSFVTKQSRKMKAQSALVDQKRRRFINGNNSTQKNEAGRKPLEHIKETLWLQFTYSSFSIAIITEYQRLFIIDQCDHKDSD